MKRSMGLMTAGFVAASIVIAGAGSAAAAGKATLNVLHGVPGAKVDVCVNGAEAKSNFTYKQRFAAQLPAGKYDIKVRAASPGTCKGAVILKASPTLKAGKNYTAVAGLNPKGAPKLFLFGNDVRKTDAGNARLTVRHTAAAPKVDVWVNGSPFLHGVPNGASWTGQVPRDDYTVRVAPAGTTTTVIGPRTFGLSAGMAYQVYATGNAKAGYIFQVIAQKTK
jgi:Domain of unknown function (DUF4397)